ALVVSGLFLLVSWPGHSAVPTAINYQGSLTDASGTPINTTLDMTFSLYDSAGAASALWSETQSVTVTNGVFSVDLGTATPFPPNFFTAPLYLGVTVVGDAEMTPRLPFRAVPFAFSAEQLVACAPGETNCAGTCVDLQTDESNCGTCGNVCVGGEICVGGVCAADGDGDGWTVGAGDCDDGDPNVNPDAAEVCNSIDDDCDASIDEPGAIGETEWFADLDADGFGDSASSIFACSQPPNTADNGGDCDDADPDVNPGAAEVCNGADDNCNSSTDEGVCICGNTVTEAFAGETCDDGNANDNDDCINACQVATCGDGVLHNQGSGTEQCDDGNAINGDGCSDACFLEGGSSCVGIPDGTLCDDADACTVPDQCQSEICVGGAPLVCDDDNICTTDSCDPVTGCVFTNLPNGTSCGPSGEVCDGAGTCLAP
ncbi:MAG: MopE-related protein, partial [Rhodospirillales bacterium]|nr:MopE-related protein [Rhodospirillales bacterium]